MAQVHVAYTNNDFGWMAPLEAALRVLQKMADICARQGQPPCDPETALGLLLGILVYGPDWFERRAPLNLPFEQRIAQVKPQAQEGLQHSVSIAAKGAKAPVMVAVSTAQGALAVAFSSWCNGYPEQPLTEETLHEIIAPLFKAKLIHDPPHRHPSGSKDG